MTIQQYSINNQYNGDRRYRKTFRYRQSGVVLIVSLVLLFGMTLLGVAILRDSGLEAKVVGNTIDHVRTREAAEITARLAEEWVENKVQMGKLPHVANFFPKNAQLTINSSGSSSAAVAAKVVIRDEVFDPSDASHWEHNGRLSEQNISGVKNDLQYVVASIGFDSGAQISNLSDAHNNSSNPTVAGNNSSNRDSGDDSDGDNSNSDDDLEISGYTRDRNLGLGTSADHAGRVILKVYGRVEGSTQGNSVVVETTYAYPYYP